MSIINKTNKHIQLILNSKAQDSLQYFMRLIIEATVRKVIEASVKLMNHQKSEELKIQHFDAAIMSLGLRQVQIASLIFSQESSQFITFEDQFIEASKSFSRIKKPEIIARWLTIDGHIPSVDQNKIMVRKQKEIQSQRQDYQFNIIHDNPINFLLPQQQQLFKYINHKLQSQKQLSIGPNWNISNILPFIMNILMNMGPSDNRVSFILQVIHSKSLVNTLEFYLHHIFSFLLKYKGKYSWQVGLQISKLIGCWQFKYPQFHNIFNQIRKDYDSKIMKLAYQVYFRIPPSIHIQDIEIDVCKNVSGAKRFVELLNMCWLRFNYPKCQYHEAFAQGRTGLISDDYLQSII